MSKATQTEFEQYTRARQREETQMHHVSNSRPISRDGDDAQPANGDTAKQRKQMHMQAASTKDPSRQHLI